MKGLYQQAFDSNFFANLYVRQGFDWGKVKPDLLYL